MMRRNFDMQLSELNVKLVEMCAFVEGAVNDAKTALLTQDKMLAMDVIKRDNTTNQMEKAIEAQCMQIIMRQQPVAKDFRQVTAILKIITDLERIGDQAEDIAEIVLMLEQKPFYKTLEHIPRMFEETVAMLKQAIDSFVISNKELAEDVRRRDDIIDNLFDVVKAETISYIRKDVNNAEQAIDLLQVAKYLERIGDHAENIAEWVVYTHTGVHIGFNELKN